MTKAEKERQILDAMKAGRWGYAKTLAQHLYHPCTCGLSNGAHTTRCPQW